jgi:glutaredoxin
MSNTIVIFTLNGCSHCKNLKGRLNDLEISYIDVEIGENQKLWDQVVQQTGHNVLPTVFIKKENSDEGPVYVPGRDYHNEDEIVEIIKNLQVK